MSEYSKKVPTLVSNTISNADELSRWVLDLNGIPYIDERHAPGLHIKLSNRAAGVTDGISNNPVLVTTDAVVSQKDGVFRYLEARCAPGKRLCPDQPDRRDLTEELFKYFWDELWRPVGRYVYAKMLPHRKYTAPLMRERVPFTEKFIVTFFYGLLARRIASGLELDKYRPEGELEKIKRVFARVEELLGDGRRYLTGATLTIADMMFAVNSAPVILPAEFGGSMAKIHSVPDDLRRQILEFQNTVAGQFAIRIYREHRPPGCDQGQLPEEPGCLARMKDYFAKLFFGRRFRIWLFSLANRRMPVFKFGARVYVNKHDLVTGLLDRDRDFTIREINRDRMAALSVAFFLGMDRSPEHDREHTITRSVVHDGDGAKIRKLLRESAGEQIELARDFKRIDVVSSLAEVVMVRLLRDYFGVDGPDETTMKSWMRILFWDLFLNQDDNQKIHRRALRAGAALKDHLERTIARRKRALQDDSDALADTLLDRMIRKQREPGNEWFDDDTIRRNISGLIIGALPTNSKAVVLVLDELLERPEELRRAAEAATQGDMKAVHQYAYEALRFNPHNPAIARFAEDDQSLEGAGGKTYKIRAKSVVIAGLSPAMFDPETFPRPGQFDCQRDLNSYMHFGYGFHECYGTYINAMAIPEMTAAVLKLKNLKRAPGRAGRGLYEGPFPNNFVLTFD